VTRALRARMAVDPPRGIARALARAARCAVFGLGLFACDTGTQYALSDTERSVYRGSCFEGRCREEITSPMGARPSPACGAGERAGFVLAGAHVVTVCHACLGPQGAPARPDLSRCRPVACAHPRDCPPWHRGRTVACREGLCVEQNPAAGPRPLDRVSAAGLCMTGAGPTSAERLALVEDRLAFARAACDRDGRCGPPAGCRGFAR
jgi:hypothetical protein